MAKKTVAQRKQDMRYERETERAMCRTCANSRTNIDGSIDCIPGGFRVKPKSVCFYYERAGG